MASPEKPAISVVIPVFLGEVLVAPLIDRLLPVLQDVASDHEILLVNDGSPDKSWLAIQELARAHPTVRGVQLARNFGQHNAVLCGLRLARFPVTVTMDDDLQHPPEEIPKLLAELAQGYDVVYGTPLHERHGFSRNLAKTITLAAFRSALGVELARKVTSFRALRTRLRDAFERYHAPFVSIDVLLTWSAHRVTAVGVRHDGKAEGASTYTTRKLIRHAINMMTGFSVVPLQVSSLLGLLLTAVGMAALGFILSRLILFGREVPGYTSLACIILVFSGAQLLALGIIGEYLARIHFQTMQRPPYVVQTTTDDESALP